MDERKTIVVSAVNLRKGGTLTILRQCLEYLGTRVAQEQGKLRVIALVHSRDLLCPATTQTDAARWTANIEYIEMPWCIRSWAHRLWAEYVTMKGISRRLARERGGDGAPVPVDLWLSLHDTTPNVVAARREVYCHTSFPFLKIIPRDWLMDPKIPMFAIMGRLYMRINVHRNDRIVVQQHWFADAMGRMLKVSQDKFLVTPPSAGFGWVTAIGDAWAKDFSRRAGNPEDFGTREKNSLPCGATASDLPTTQSRQPNSPATFLYASTPDCHKNFETLCEASRLLEQEVGKGRFRTIITVGGDENRYARWLHRKWGRVDSIDFHGLMAKDELYDNYAAAACFVFPSRVETWGLPISEYMAANPCGKMLLADLPYARETSGGRGVYFPVRDAAALKEQMKNVIKER